MNSQSPEPPKTSPPEAHDLKFTFACPDCGKAGRIAWSQLPRAIHCAQCSGYFWIDAAGRLQSSRRAKKVRGECPRCHYTTITVRELLRGGLPCPECGMTLVSAASASSNRTAGAGQGKSFPDAKTPSKSKRRPPLVSVRARRLALGLLAACLLGIAVVAAAATFTAAVGEPSAKRLAVAFTRACLAPEADVPAGRVTADGHAALAHWLALLRPAAGHQPFAESAQISAEVIERHADRVVLRVRVDYRGRGSATHVQVWRQEEGRLRFDPKATLARLAE